MRVGLERLATVKVHYLDTQYSAVTNPKFKTVVLTIVKCLQKTLVRHS